MKGCTAPKSSENRDGFVSKCLNKSMVSSQELTLDQFDPIGKHKTCLEFHYRECSLVFGSKLVPSVHKCSRMV